MDLYSVQKELSLGKSLNNINLRVTFYSRVSTNHVEQKKSLTNQTEYFEKYIEENPNWIYVKGYVDDGISGTTDFKRDNFMQMIEDAHEGKFDLIITKEISRFSRNTLDSIKYTRELLTYGVAIIFLNDNINTALPDSELRLTIMASMAQDEIRRLSERVKFGMNRAIERGEILGNNSLYGYKKDKITKKMFIIPKEAKIIREIYYLYGVKKMSLNEIIKELKKRNIKTCQEKEFSITTVSRMIQNPKYKGYYCAKKSEVVDYMTKKVKYFPEEKWYVYEDKKRIPPIVDEYLWNLANERLKGRQSSYKNKKIDKSIYENRYVFSGKIICACHNTTFHRRIFCKATQEVSWLCSKYLKEGKKACNTANIRESELNKILDDIILKLNIKQNDVFKILKETYKKDDLLVDKSIFINNKKSSIKQKITKSILKNIVAQKDNIKNRIELEIYLNYSKEGKKIFLFSENYIFTRGNATKSTKRYKMNYFIKCFL